jgi:hypothetical protein
MQCHVLAKDPVCKSSLPFEGVLHPLLTYILACSPSQVTHGQRSDTNKSKIKNNNSFFSKKKKKKKKNE